MSLSHPVTRRSHIAARTAVPRETGRRHIVRTISAPLTVKIAAGSDGWGGGALQKRQNFVDLLGALDVTLGASFRCSNIRQQGLDLGEWCVLGQLWHGLWLGESTTWHKSKT